MSIIILIIGLACFVLSFFCECKELLNVLAFILPVVAAIIEIRKGNTLQKHMDDELAQRPPSKLLTQEEYDKLKSEGRIDNGTVYYIPENKD